MLTVQIYEGPAAGNFYNFCNSLDATCGTHQTPRHQSYQPSVVADQPANQQIEEAYFVKGGTWIWFTLRGYPTKMSAKTWSAVVDSFQPGHYDNPKIIRGGNRGP